MKHNVKKYFVPAIGAIAFAVGGYFTRAKALDAFETIEDRFNKDKSTKPEETSAE